MGRYLNPRCGKYEELVRSDTFVDKSGLIKYTNSKLCRDGKCIASSRPRRFGKTLAAQMLCAYYCKAYDSRELFDPLKIGQESSFATQLNKWDVLFLDIRELMDGAEKTGGERFLEYIGEQTVSELREAFPGCVADNVTYLAYNIDTGKARIPNQEIRDEFRDVIENSSGWGEVSKALQCSDDLLEGCNGER